MNNSGNTTRSAPCAAASARALRTFSALPAMSPSVELSCATAIASLSAGLLSLRALIRNYLAPALRRGNQQAGMAGARLHCRSSWPTSLALEPCGGRHWPNLTIALFPEQLSQQEREIDGLLGIEPWIADRVIAVVEVGIRNGAGAAGAFGDILASHLQVHAAGVAALGCVDVEEAAHFLEDQLEGPRLVTARRGDGVAVHRVT